MRSEKKVGVKFFIFLVISIVIGILTINLYASLKVNNLSNNLVYAVKDKIDNNHKVNNNAEFYGHSIEEISKEYYKNQKLHRLKNSKYQNSNISKEKNIISINTKKKKLEFEDNYDHNCMACTIEHEIVGEIRELNKIVIETFYYRSGIHQIIDLDSGQIDTLCSKPIISPNNKLIAVENYISKDTLTTGIKMYSTKNGQINFIKYMGENWIPKEMFWRNNQEIFAKANLVNEDQIEFEKLVYLRIKN